MSSGQLNAIKAMSNLIYCLGFPLACQETRRNFEPFYSKICASVLFIYYRWKKEHFSFISILKITFHHSISCVFLIDKLNKICKNSKTFEINALSTKKKLLKREENNITPAKTNALIAQTSSKRLKLTIQTYRMRNKKNLKWSLDNFKRRYQKHLCKLVLI